MGKNKQKNVSFTQLMNSVDESVKSKETQIIPEKKPEPVVNNTVAESAEITEIPEGMTVANDTDGQKVVKNVTNTIDQMFKTPAERLKEEAKSQVNYTTATQNSKLSADAQKVLQFINDYFNFNNGKHYEI